VTDAHKASGQHMQKKAAQELGGCHGHRALLAAVGIVLPTKRDTLSIKCQQTMIRDGDSMGVAAKITQYLLRTAESLLGIDDPVLTMQSANQLSELPRTRPARQPGLRSVVSDGDTGVSTRR